MSQWRHEDVSKIRSCQKKRTEKDVRAYQNASQQMRRSKRMDKLFRSQNGAFCVWHAEIENPTCAVRNKQTTKQHDETATATTRGTKQQKTNDNNARGVL